MPAEAMTAPLGSLDLSQHSSQAVQAVYDQLRQALLVIS